MQDLKPETISRFKELYKEFPELIDYRIKSGNIYEKAQAMLIKSAVVSDLQVPDCLPAMDTCKTSVEYPLLRKIKSDIP
ncbi:hypothetical protein [Methanosarcina sp. UBA411]|jgi:hypothetical protein|uniref:hypothetical protein n=1 Tax=Methanosarcina sp. UBA411 TaxID=1915589 RepID=UPI0025D297D9|nr:hypothetical protein [Methanosarcina sp. UBA411]